MIGIELVSDREQRTPDAALAREVRRYCREHGVLVGVGGSEGNVVRMQPPLVIEERDLNEALDVIGAGIESLSSAHAG
jgi:4-aminobutyrate aminotransferase-like enzyme